MKTCTKCKIEKPFEAFCKHIKTKDGYKSECKECVKERKKELKKNPLMQLEKQIRSSILLENKLLSREGKKLCSRCNGIFLIDDLKEGKYCEKCKIEIDKEYRKKNKEKINEYYKEYRKKNKDKLKEKEKEYRDKRKEYKDKNKEKIKQYQKEYDKEYYEKNKDKIKEYQREYHLKKKLEKELKN